MKYKEININFTGWGHQIVDILLNLNSAKRVENDNFVEYQIPFISHGQAWKLYYLAKKLGLETKVGDRDSIAIKVGKFKDGGDYWIDIEKKRSSYTSHANNDHSRPLRQAKVYVKSKSV